MGITSDPNDPGLGKKRPNGQNEAYLVLSDEERAKGFVRPVRCSYVHVGPARPRDLRDLTEEERKRYAQFGYVKFEPYAEDKSPLTGRFWKQAELGRIGGCGTVTTMGHAIAETYARNPKFYGATFCCGCGSHYPVGEFTWDKSTEIVGS